MKGRRRLRARWRVQAPRNAALAQAEFISAEHFYQNGAPTQAACVGSCGGPSKEAVMQQIEGFVAERKG